MVGGKYIGTISKSSQQFSSAADFGKSEAERNLSGGRAAFSWSTADNPRQGYFVLYYATNYNLK